MIVCYFVHNSTHFYSFIDIYRKNRNKISTLTTAAIVDQIVIARVWVVELITAAYAAVRSMYWWRRDGSYYDHYTSCSIWSYDISDYCNCSSV